MPDSDPRTIDAGEFDRLVALLQWQLELGADEACLDAPVNRYEAVEPAVGETAAGEPARSDSRAVEPVAPARRGGVPGGVPCALPGALPGEVLSAPGLGSDPVAQARAMAEGAPDLAALRAALAAFEGCELKKGARNLVFADGVPGARVMIVGEAPGRDEDAVGRPFVGRAGQLLDLMFAAIDMGRDHATAPLYITNVLPWRPPQNREPDPAEIAMLLPFVERHVALAKPEILIAMGNISCMALLGRKGITRLRGTWCEAWGRPVLPMFHPAYLLRNPSAKRAAWHDLLTLQARLRG